MENEASLSPLATQPVGKLLARYAVPCVISLLVNSLYNMVDQIFIGRGVGYLGNGATNVIYPLTVIVLSVALMVGDGGASFLSIRLGAGRKEEATRGIASVISFAILAGVVLAVVMGIFLSPLVYLFGCTDAIYPYAMDYGRIIVVGLPFVLVGTVFTAIERADGSPNYSMASLLAGAVINTILDPLFIFVFQWGVKGAALATILGQIVTCVMGLVYLGRFKSIHPKPQDYRVRWRYCKAALSLGVSSFITQMAIVVIMAVINNLLTKYGAASVYGEDIPLAVMGIVMKVNQLVIAATVGIASGAQPIIGYNYGAGNPQRVKKTFAWVVFWAEVLAVAAFVAYQCFPVQLISIFGKEGDLYNEFATKCFRIFLLVVILNGFQTVAGLFAQAIGHPVKAAIMSLSRQILFLVPAEFLLAAKMGVLGVLWAGPVADTLAFLLSLALVLYDLSRLKRQCLCPAHCAS